MYCTASYVVLLLALMNLTVNFYRKEIVNYVTLIILRYPIAEY